jgi:hypothetical protein
VLPCFTPLHFHAPGHDWGVSILTVTFLQRITNYDVMTHLPLDEEARIGGESYLALILREDGLVDKHTNNIIDRTTQK